MSRILKQKYILILFQYIMWCYLMLLYQLLRILQEYLICFCCFIKLFPLYKPAHVFGLRGSTTILVSTKSVLHKVKKKKKKKKTLKKPSEDHVFCSIISWTFTTNHTDFWQTSLVLTIIEKKKQKKKHTFDWIIPIHSLFIDSCAGHLSVSCSSPTFQVSSTIQFNQIFFLLSYLLIPL